MLKSKSRNKKRLNPEIWGPSYWHFLHSVAYKYPEHPNPITKRKYYDLIMNFPLFIPDSEMGDRFSEMLDKYPIQPYLDSRESFIRWVWFIHNKYNRVLNKPEIGLFESLDKYVEKNTSVSPETKPSSYLWIYEITLISIFALMVVFQFISS